LEKRIIKTYVLKAMRELIRGAKPITRSGLESRTAGMLVDAGIEMKTVMLFSVIGMTESDRGIRVMANHPLTGDIAVNVAIVLDEV
jgi:hypothetical protein